MRERLQIIVAEGETCTGISQQCPPPTIKVEKVNGGLRLFGVVIGNNCQVSLPAFGLLFMFIGIILTVLLVVAFKGPDINEDPSEYESREETAKNIRILGPVCICVGITMLIFAVILKYLSRKAQDEETRIGFYCPVHGDFYPLSPGINPRRYSFSEIVQEKKWWPSFACLKKNQSSDPIVSDIPPCPHSISPSNRSSFDGQHIHLSNSNPSTVIITAATISNGLTIPDNNSDTNQNYGSIRSLSVPNDVASFPTYRSRSNPPTSPPTPIHFAAASNAKRLSCPILPEIGAVSPLQVGKMNKPTSILTNVKTELKMVQPAVFCNDQSSRTSDNSLYYDDETRKRKSVSILLPPE